jgi:hypothetical protein
MLLVLVQRLLKNDQEWGLPFMMMPLVLILETFQAGLDYDPNKRRISGKHLTISTIK